MKHQQTFTTRAYEVDADYRLKWHHIPGYFLEAFARSCDDRGIAAFHLQKEHRSWVMTDMRVEYLSSRPFWRRQLQVETWAQALQGLRLLQDFRITDSNTHLIAQGTSSWSIIRENNRHPEPVSVISDRVQANEEAVFPDFRFSRIQGFDGKYNEDAQKVRSFDIDFNKHLNSVRYIAGAIETIPVYFLHSLKN